MQSITIYKGMQLVEKKVNTVEVKDVSVPTNHIIVIDCSGSMYGQLQLIRQQLKNRLPTLLKPEDKISVVWFSGKGQFGRLVDTFTVNSITDLGKLNTAIDQWIRPVGLTGFVEPLRDVIKLCKENGPNTYSMIFLTDGGDNCWNRQDIVNTTAELAGVLSGATFVEYGWGCDRKLMVDMAAAANGTLVFADGFDSYDPIVSNAINSKFTNKRVEVDVELPECGLVWSTSTNGPCTYKVADGKISVPESVESVWYLSPVSTRGKVEDPDHRQCVAMLQGCSLFSARGKSDAVKGMLASTGNADLYTKFSNAYGKQNLTDFQTLAISTSNGPEWKKRDIVLPKPDAFTIIDLLSFLSSDKGNRIVPDMMDYKSMSRGTESTGDKEDQVTFVYTDKNASYPIENLTWNEDRPNVSILVTRDILITLPESRPVGVPKTVSSFVFRNYNIVHDGIVNVDKLPVCLSEETFGLLKGQGMVSGDYENKVYMLDIRSLPTINANMMANVSAADLFNAEVNLTKLRAAQKVIKAFTKELRVESTDEQGKTDADTYLASLGITGRGYSPKKVQAAAVDRYDAVELVISIKGLSSVPSLADYRKKLATGKALTAREKLTGFYVSEFDGIIKQFGDNKAGALKWFEEREDLIKKMTRALIRQMAEIKFAVVIGQTWFREFDSRDNCGLVVNVDGEDYECTVALKDVVIEI
jgi:hypothetical protein